MSQTINAKGVSPILPTPFTASGAVDVPSLRQLIQYQKTVGVTSVSILGFMGKADKISTAEHQTIIKTVAEEATARAGTLDVWVGVRTLGTMGAVEACHQPEALVTSIFRSCTFSRLNKHT